MAEGGSENFRPGIRRRQRRDLREPRDWISGAADALKRARGFADAAMYQFARPAPHAARDLESGMLYSGILRARCSEGGWSSASDDSIPNIYLTPSPPATPEKPAFKNKHSAAATLEVVNMICWGIAIFAMALLAAYAIGIIHIPDAPISCRNGGAAWTRRCGGFGYEEDAGNAAAVGYVMLPQNGA
jgi:hypothetical protein